MASSTGGRVGLSFLPMLCANTYWGELIGPADNGNLLTTDTDLAYKNAIKGSRTGPYIMGESLFSII